MVRGREGVALILAGPLSMTRPTGGVNYCRDGREKTNKRKWYVLRIKRLESFESKRHSCYPMEDGIAGVTLTFEGF